MARGRTRASDPRSHLAAEVLVVACDVQGFSASLGHNEIMAGGGGGVCRPWVSPDGRPTAPALVHSPISSSTLTRSSRNLFQHLEFKPRPSRFRRSPWGLEQPTVHRRIKAIAVFHRQIPVVTLKPSTSIYLLTFAGHISASRVPVLFYGRGGVWFRTASLPRAEVVPPHRPHLAQGIVPGGKPRSLAMSLSCLTIRQFSFLPSSPPHTPTSLPPSPNHSLNRPHPPTLQAYPTPLPFPPLANLIPFFSHW